MNLYELDYSLLDIGFIDPTFIQSISFPHSSIVDCKNWQSQGENLIDELPHRRHDGISPLPLGMDWSPPPRFWDGPNTTWPHDFHTGWSYCVTIPSWTISSDPGGADYVVFYRVQVGLQSPEGITTTRRVLRRFSDFVKLASALKRFFRYKQLPTAPSKGFLRIKSKKILEERRCSLEDWMAKVLSDIEFSRSAPLAYFLELEAVARSSFIESNHQVLGINLMCNVDTSSDPFLNLSDASIIAGHSELASNFGDDSTYGTPEMLSPSLSEATANESLWENDNWKLTEFDEGGQRFNNNDQAKIHMSASSNDTLNSLDVSQQNSTSSKTSASVEPKKCAEMLSSSELQFSRNMLVVLPTDEQQKLNRFLTAMQQRLVTSKIDTEELIARLNQELAVRHYLSTKVKHLEIELETAKKNSKQNMEQALLIERERFTQMQWDMEEMRRKCMDMELRWKAEQDERGMTDAIKPSTIQENEALRKELDSAIEQLKNLKKCQEDSDSRSKSDVKLLVKEVRSLRISQLELKQELDRLAKERAEFERGLQQEKIKWGHNNSANAYLLHECKILRDRLEECGINFLIEEENKLKMNTSSLSDAVDILTTSDNRVGLLLAEAQLLAQEVESSIGMTRIEDSDVMSTNNELRKMLTDVLIDNAALRKQVNFILHGFLWTSNKSPDKSETSIEEESTSNKSMLGKFLES